VLPKNVVICQWQSRKRRYFGTDNLNESLVEINNDNGIREMKFAMSEYLIVKTKMLPYSNIQEYASKSTGRK
jgi:hypothetical protein